MTHKYVRFSGFIVCLTLSLSCGDEPAFSPVIGERIQGSWVWERTEGYWCPPGYCNPDSSGTTLVMNIGYRTITTHVDDSLTYQYQYQLSAESIAGGGVVTILTRTSQNGSRLSEGVHFPHVDTLLLDDMSLHRSLSWYSRAR